MLCTFLIYISIQISHAQNTPTQSYRQYKTTQIDSQINLTNTAKKNLWLNLVPSPGYSIRNGFTLSFNLNTLSQYYQSVQANKIEIERLRFQMYNALDTDIYNLENTLTLLKTDIEIYKMEVEIFNNEEKIYTIESGRYTNHRTTILDWLKYKNSYQAKKLALFTTHKTLINRINQISYKLKNAELGSALLISLNN